VIFGIVATGGGTNGVVPWKVSTQKFVPFASVSPGVLTLAPGQSQALQVSVTTPRAPGDSSGSIVLTSTGGGIDPFVGKESNSVPVTLRSMLDLAHGGSFHGTLTGGNGRPPGLGQVQFYEFNVPPGHSSITANVSIANDPTDTVATTLVAPDGTALGFGQNNFPSGSKTLTAYTLNPTPGTWTLIVDFAGPVVGNEISQPFTGNVTLDDTDIAVSGIPNSEHVRLSAGVPVTVPVKITNRGIAQQAFFIDARLNVTTNISLANIDPPPTSAGYPLPLPLPPAPPEWLVPTQTSAVHAVATATLPVMFDYGPAQGDPDLVGVPTLLNPNRASGSFVPAGGKIQPGVWLGFPSEFGSYSAPAAAGLVKMTLTATTKAFDPTVTTPTGDLWLTAVDANTAVQPAFVDPGQSVTIPVTFTPAGAPGTRVSGTLYVDTVVFGLAPSGQITGDEVAAIPYSYTIQ
jgi:hypothetical protein